MSILERVRTWLARADDRDDLSVHEHGLAPVDVDDVPCPSDCACRQPLT